MIRVALSVGLLTLPLWIGLVGCASFTEPPVQSLDEWMRQDAAVRSSGD